MINSLKEATTVMVTGGAGYIGSHTVRHLVAMGYKVVVLDNLIYGHPEALVDPSVILIDGSIGDREILKEVFTTYPIEAVVHFAAYAYVGESVNSPLKYYENNVSASIVLLQMMEVHGIDKIVFSSSCATYGIPETVPIHEKQIQRPINPYGRTKLIFEWILEDCEVAWGLQSVCLRYFNACGASADSLIGEDHDPETHLIPRVLMAAKGEISKLTVFGTDYPTPDGTCVRDYIHVEDLATGHEKALSHLFAEKGSLKCNLSTGSGFSIKEILKAAEEVTGQAIPVTYAERRAGDPPELVGNPITAQKSLGWKAQWTDLRRILESSWNWMHQEHGGHY